MSMLQLDGRQIALDKDGYLMELADWSPAAAEALAAEVWPGEALGAAALPCPRKGQRVVLAIANPAATLEALRVHARAAGVAEIQQPSELRILPEIPVMASGKTDLPRLQALLEAMDVA